MSKRYPIKADKKFIAKLKPFWEQLLKLEDEHYDKVQKLEKLMQQTLKVDGIEFFMTDNCYCGIGNIDRTMQLIHGDELSE